VERALMFERVPYGVCFWCGKRNCTTAWKNVEDVNSITGFS